MANPLQRVFEAERTARERLREAEARAKEIEAEARARAGEIVRAAEAYGRQLESQVGSEMASAAEARRRELMAALEERLQAARATYAARREELVRAIVAAVLGEGPAR